MHQLAGLARVHEVLLHPGVSRPARVGGAARHRPDVQRPPRTQACLQVFVDALLEVRQLVDKQPVDLRALIIELVPLVLAVSKPQRAAVCQAIVVRRSRIAAQAPRNRSQRLGHQRIVQLAQRPPEQVRLRARVLKAPKQRLHHHRLALSPARRAAKEHLIRGRPVKQSLLLGRPVIQSNSHVPSLSPGCAT